MQAPSRALRNLGDDLTNANNQLRTWRINGDATKIQFWLRRRDQLLDRWTELHQQELAETGLNPQAPTVTS